MLVRRRLPSGKFLQAFRDPHLGHLIWHYSVTGAKEVTNHINSAVMGYLVHGPVKFFVSHLKEYIVLHCIMGCL